MAQEYTMSDLKKDMDEMKKEAKRDKFETRLQTIGLLLVFFFGIATITDLKYKIKKGI